MSGSSCPRRRRRTAHKSGAGLVDGLAAAACIVGEKGAVLHANAAAADILAAQPGGLKGASLCRMLCGRIDCGEETAEQACPLRKPGCAASRVILRGTYKLPAHYRWEEDGVRPIEGRVPMTVVCSRFSGAGPDKPRTQRNLVLFVPAPRLEGADEEEDWRSMFVHDIRNSLSNVLATMSLVAEDPAACAEDPGFLRLAARSKESCLRISELLRTYLTLASLEAGSHSLSAERRDLASLAESTADEFRLAGEEAGVEIDVEVERGLSVRADPELLPRVLANLVGNAVKHSREGGRVLVAAEPLGEGFVRFRVADSGEGIPYEDRHRIFERYYQVKDPSGTRSRGFGLGLAFCKKAVEAMGGAISVNPAESGGSEFRVDLVREGGPVPAR